MASLIPIDGEVFTRIQQQRAQRERLPYVNRSPSVGEMMAIGQVGAQALGGLGNMVIQGVGAHQARAAWDEANQRYRDEQGQQGLQREQMAGAAEQPDFSRQAVQFSQDREDALRGPQDLTQPLQAMMDRNRPQQTVGQMIAPRMQREAPPAIAGDESKMIPPTFPPLYQTPMQAPVAAQAMPVQEIRNDAAPEQMVDAPMPHGGDTRYMEQRNFAPMQTEVRDLPTVGELRNMAFMAGQGNDPKAKQKVIDMMNRMPGAFGGPQNLTDVLTGGHEERGQQSVYDLMRQGHGKSPLEMALDMERINNLQSQQNAREGKAARDAAAFPLAQRIKSLQADVTANRIPLVTAQAELAALKANEEPERFQRALDLAGAQIGELGARTDLEGGKLGVLERETVAKENMARTALSRAATDARRLNLQDRLNFFKRPEARIHDPANPIVGKLSTDLLDIDDKLNVLAEKLKIPAKDRDALLMNGTEFARAVNASQASADEKQKVMAEYEGLKNSRAPKAKALSAAGYDPTTYGATKLGETTATTSAQQPPAPTVDQMAAEAAGKPK